jgi:hypothetical protein
MPRASAWPSPAAGRSGRCTNSAPCAPWTKPATGLDLTRLDCYVGVSSGAFFAAGLANRMDTAELCRIFITGDSDDVVFRPETFLRLATDEYLRRAARFPKLAARLTRDLLSGRGDSRWSDLVTRIGGLVPTGIFDNSRVEHFLREVFTRRGRSNDFRKLERPLYVIGVDLDSGEAVRFGDAKAGTTCRSRARCRPAPPCPACIRPSRSAAATSSMARCAGRCTPRWCWSATST